MSHQEQNEMFGPPPPMIMSSQRRCKSELSLLPPGSNPEPCNGLTSSAALQRRTAGLHAPNAAKARDGSSGLANKCTACAIFPWLQALCNWEGAPEGVTNTQKRTGRQEDFKQYPTEVTPETAVTKKKWEQKLFQRYLN